MKTTKIPKAAEKWLAHTGRRVLAKIVGGGITEIKILGMSPSYRYINVQQPGETPEWIHRNNASIVEVLPDPPPEVPKPTAP